MPEFFLRKVNETDIDSIVRCYNQLAIDEQASLLSDTEWLHQKCQQRQGVCAEHSGEMVAFAAWDCFGHRPLIETRTCFVLPFARGFGLQRAMHGLRSSYANTDQIQLVDAVSAVKPNNVHSIKNLIAIGFSRWKQPDPELSSLCGKCPKYSCDLDNSGFPAYCCCDYYLCPANTFYEYGLSWEQQLNPRGEGFFYLPKENNRASKNTKLG